MDERGRGRSNKEAIKFPAIPKWQHLGRTQSVPTMKNVCLTFGAKSICKSLPGACFSSEMVPEVSNIKTAQQIPTGDSPILRQVCECQPTVPTWQYTAEDLAVVSSLCRSLSASERSERFTCLSRIQKADCSSKTSVFGRNMHSNGVPKHYQLQSRGKGNGSAASHLKTFDHLPRCRLLPTAE